MEDAIDLSRLFVPTRLKSTLSLNLESSQSGQGS